MEGSCLRLVDSKEGASTRAIGLPVVEFLESRWKSEAGTYVFPGQGDDNAFGSFPNHWEKMIIRNTPLADITPHVLRHSFASIANDLGFAEVTIAALVGHAKGTVTSKFPCDFAMYAWRHLVENFFCKLKEFRRIATRYDKPDCSFSSMIYLASSIIAMR
jgi:transposase